MKNLLSFLSLTLFVACGGGHNPDQDLVDGVPRSQSVGDEKFVTVDSSDQLEFGDGTLSGVGTVRFASDLESVASNYHYKLIFSLEEGTELTLHSHANADLANGLDIRFKRVGASLQVFGTASGVTDDWTSFFKDINATQAMAIGIDVHNDEPITHFIFWDNLSGAELLDSAKDVAGGPGKGYGQNWGLSLLNAFVNKVEKGEPRGGH
ncbi:hypothetical protein GW915_10940 [bacterium]|nr:hypothetical protein [bacterium]